MALSSSPSSAPPSTGTGCLPWARHRAQPVTCVPPSLLTTCHQPSRVGAITIPHSTAEETEARAESNFSQHIYLRRIQNLSSSPCCLPANDSSWCFLGTFYEIRLLHVLFLSSSIVLRGRNLYGPHFAGEETEEAEKGEGHRTQRCWVQVQTCPSPRDKNIGLKSVPKLCPVGTAHVTNSGTETHPWGGGLPKSPGSHQQRGAQASTASLCVPMTVPFYRRAHRGMEKQMAQRRIKGEPSQ